MGRGIRFGGYLLAVLAIVVPTLGCNAEAEPERRANRARGVPAEESPPVGSMYERDVVFLGREGDSLVAVPFSFSSTVAPDAVVRTIQGWLYRDGSWDPFFRTEWDTDPTRTPWRVLPHGPLGILMGLDDALEGIVFQQGPRQMEVRLGVGAEPWSGPLGETLSLQGGEMAISGASVPGVVLELARTWRSDVEPPGDWFFLASGDSLGLILLDSSAPDQAPRFRAWGRVLDQEVQWTEVQLDPVETRPFEPARREVPSRWILQAGGQRPDAGAPELTAELFVVSSLMEAGEGSGPLLPVSGLFRVQGEISIAGRQAAVEGLARHRQW